MSTLKSYLPSLLARVGLHLHLRLHPRPLQSKRPLSTTGAISDGNGDSSDSEGNPKRPREYSASSEAKIDGMLEAAINEQIALEFSSALLYFGMSAWFSRPDVALGGVAKYFHNNYKEELEHAEMLSRYQVSRLGTVRPPALTASAPEDSHSWPTALSAFEAALAREELLLRSLRRLARAAEQEGDAHLAHFATDEMVAHQVEDVAEKVRICSQLRRVGGGPGLSVYDRSLREWGGGEEGK